MLAYLILVVSSALVGLAAVLLARPNAKFDPKVFLTRAPVNAAALGSMLLFKKPRPG